MTKSQPLSDDSTERQTPLVLAHTVGRVGVVTLNRPKVLNALSEQLVSALIERLEAFDHDAHVRAIVLTGGPQIFAAGADIKEMAPMSAAEISDKDPLAQWDRLGKISKPLIAAVNGYALGGGCELAMNCDMIVAGEGAVFGQPEILLGVMPGAGGTQRLARIVGAARALELVWSGKQIDARKAQEWGLVSIVAPNSLVMDEAMRLARELAAQPEEAVREIKASVYAGLDMALDEGLEQERRRFYSLFDTADQKEGMNAFLQKRKPSFK